MGRGISKTNSCRAKQLKKDCTRRAMGRKIEQEL